MGSCPDEWFYWLVVVLVGRCPGGELSYMSGFTGW